MLWPATSMPAAVSNPVAVLPSRLNVRGAGRSCRAASQLGPMIGIGGVALMALLLLPAVPRCRRLVEDAIRWSQFQQSPNNAPAFTPVVRQTCCDEWLAGGALQPGHDFSTAGTASRGSGGGQAPAYRFTPDLEWCDIHLPLNQRLVRPGRFPCSFPGTPGP